VKSTLLGLLLTASAGLVVYGVFQWSTPAGWIVAGVLLAVLSLLFVLDVPDDTQSAGGDEL